MCAFPRKKSQNHDPRKLSCMTHLIFQSEVCILSVSVHFVQVLLPEKCSSETMFNNVPLILCMCAFVKKKKTDVQLFYPFLFKGHTVRVTWAISRRQTIQAGSLFVLIGDTVFFIFDGRLAC